LLVRLLAENGAEKFLFGSELFTRVRRVEEGFHLAANETSFIVDDDNLKFVIPQTFFVADVTAPHTRIRKVATVFRVFLSVNKYHFSQTAGRPAPSTGGKSGHAALIAGDGLGITGSV
jgi:hypothetical protein